MKMKKVILALGSLGLALPAMASVAISSEISTFTSTAEGYVEAALPAVFAIVGLYFLVKIIKRFTK
jgi:TRAP-type C4-dicarboxylate transport system permease small subunit